MLAQSDTVPGDGLDAAAWGDGSAATAGAFTQAGLAVSVILDSPYPGVDIPDCVAEHLDDVTACTSARGAVVPYPGRRDAVAESASWVGAQVLDPLDWTCTQEECPAVVGNVLVYRDSSHLTATYSRWLAPILAGLLTP